jgi:hypothetical protein
MQALDLAARRLDWLCWEAKASLEVSRDTIHSKFDSGSTVNA